MATASTTLPVVFRYYVPQTPLSGFVALLWYWRGHEVQFSRERLLPMATSELVVKLGTGTTTDAGLSGPQSEAFIIERTEMDEMVGIHFHPGGAFPFLNLPVGELHGLHVSLGDLWGKQASTALVCRLLEARTPETKLRLLEEWLIGIAKHPFKHHPAVAFALREFQRDPGILSSAYMAERVGFSQRHFIQLFRDEVGLTPKLFCRVQRFQNVIRAVHKRDDVDWADVALSCGYFDQSHFNHDFRQFSGLTPTEYLTLRTDHTNHVLVP